MHLLISILMITLTSCGKNHQTIVKKAPNPVRVKEEKIDIDADVRGEYLAILESVNLSVTSKITGAFTFARDLTEDELIGDVRLNNGGAKVVHAQHVRVGRRCPQLQDDLNGDGIIDAIEGEKVYGESLFPLDGDLSSQSSHYGVFPIGDIYGNYIYSKLTKFSSFIQDLRNMNAEDGHLKLKQDEPLAMEGRVVVIQGADPELELPSNVKGLGRLSPHQALPIACGVIRKVLRTPGEIDDGLYQDESSFLF